MNILIIGTNLIEQNIIKLCYKSKFLEHLYTASDKPLEDVPNIEYNDFEDLAYKIKALHIDIVFLSDKNLIQAGLVEFFREKFINVISVNKKWFNLESSRIASKQLMNYYSINNPEIIKAPMVFPLVIKTVNPGLTKVVYSMEELLEYKERLAGKQNYLEDFYKGEVVYLLSIWDGKNLLSFDKNMDLTEVQVDRLQLYKTKLSFMLSDENADFIGFFVTKLIWSKNDWYVLDYIMRINNDLDVLSIFKEDFLYILNSAIYQKLNEVENKISY